MILVLILVLFGLLIYLMSGTDEDDMFDLGDDDYEDS